MMKYGGMFPSCKEGFMNRLSDLMYTHTSSMLLTWFMFGCLEAGIFSSSSSSSGTLELIPMIIFVPRTLFTEKTSNKSVFYLISCS